MNTYKITNITNLLGKRETNFNKVVDVEYLDKRIKKANKLKAGQTMFLSIPSLPLSVHRLRIKGLISISEVSPAELAKTMAKPQPKAKKKPVKDIKPKKAVAMVTEEVAMVTEEVTDAPKETVTRKTTSKKTTNK